MFGQPTLSDDELDELLGSVRREKKLPPGVVFAGDHHDGEILHVGVSSSSGESAVYELCIRPKPERATGRKWELVRPMFLSA